MFYFRTISLPNNFDGCSNVGKLNGASKNVGGFRRGLNTQEWNRPTYRMTQNRRWLWYDHVTKRSAGSCAFCLLQRWELSVVVTRTVSRPRHHSAIKKREWVKFHKQSWIFNGELKIGDEIWIEKYASARRYFFHTKIYKIQLAKKEGFFSSIPLCSLVHEQATGPRSLFLCSPKHAGQPKKW